MKGLVATAETGGQQRRRVEGRRVLASDALSTQQQPGELGVWNAALAPVLGWPQLCGPRAFLSPRCCSCSGRGGGLSRVG